jgi:hypothetical protein
MREIILCGRRAERLGLVALVDDEDFDRVSAFKWFAFPLPGSKSGRHYAMRTFKLPDGRGSSERMHQMVAGHTHPDHIDGDGLNNQRANLRRATSAQNGANRRSTVGSSSRFKGVTWHKRDGHWQASMKVDGRNRHLGSFSSEDEAARVYDAAALATWGEYAHLNFPVVPHV